MAGGLTPEAAQALHEELRDRGSDAGGGSPERLTVPETREKHRSLPGWVCTWVGAILALAIVTPLLRRLPGPLIAAGIVGVVVYLLVTAKSRAR